MSTERKSSGKKSIADELKARSRKMNGRPRKIGVMNPYVLVRMLSPLKDSENRRSPPPKLSKIDLHDKKTLNILNAHFRRNNQVTTSFSYRQLFDPKISPLYRRLKGFHKIKVGSGVKNPDIINLPKYYVFPNVKNPKYVNEPRGGKSQVFGDIIQGAATNCYFHAALHSDVWVNWTDFPSSMAEIAFNDQTIKVNATFLLDASYNPVGAQLSLDNEYWGCAWEKAYAEFKGLAKSSYSTNPATTPPYDPNVLAFDQGDPLESLSEITNLPFDFSTDTFGVPSAYDDPTTYASCYSILDADNNGGLSGTSMITANPTVAWTKGNCATYGPKGAIIPNHAYSILGTFKYGVPSIPYIILRNPWGISFSTTGYPLFCQGGAYNPGLNQGIALGPASAKGIFGLKDTAFKTYFAGFGWVQAP